MPVPPVGAGVAWASILHALWLFLPAYVANMSPVFVARLVPTWNARIDGGRLGRDGKALLGPGKTWRGLVGGAVTGGLTALAQSVTAGGMFADLDFGRSLGSPLWAIALFGAFVGLMALAGDAVKSYFKRRRGKEGGAPWVPFDQLDFVVFGLLAVVVASPLLADGWTRDAFLGDWVVLATIVLLTPILHLGTNMLGYALGLKKVPW